MIYPNVNSTWTVFITKNYKSRFKTTTIIITLNWKIFHVWRAWKKTRFIHFSQRNNMQILASPVLRHLSRVVSRKELLHLSVKTCPQSKDKGSSYELYRWERENLSWVSMTITFFTHKKSWLIHDFEFPSVCYRIYPSFPGETVEELATREGKVNV